MLYNVANMLLRVCVAVSVCVYVIAYEVVVTKTVKQVKVWGLIV